MKLIKTPTKGMNDYLPREVALREYVKSVITDSYSRAGFSMIETPAVEHVENLTGKNGGDNEKLIFRILKRGEKLDVSAGEDALCDSGLRYDLTVPLSRYYANNSAKLPTPFLAMQIGNVWRADRPQKGRYRQFTQCDIDIIGDGSSGAEITLISSTAGVLRRLGFENFTIRINDRRLLRLCTDACALPSEECDKIFIILDKMDKIGIDGVKSELVEAGFDPEAVERYAALYADADNVSVTDFASRIGGEAADIADELASVMRCAAAATVGSCNIKFDPTLVRGMSYYTGTIFEIEMDGYGYSVGGGGRYDDMLGKFTGQRVPACGFSLGFERIVVALADSGFTPPAPQRSVAVLVSKGVAPEELIRIHAEAAAMRTDGARVLVTTKMKNVYFQKTRLEEDGYSEFIEY